MTGSAAAAAAAAAAAGGDNSRPALQRLMADVKLLQSKVQQFNAHSLAADQNLRPYAGQNTRSVLPSDNTGTEIDELKRHYDAEVFLCTVVS